jgi:flagellar biosynthetic protein FlhB
MPEQNGEKTHDATPHRRQQAREKGQVAFSHDLGSALLLVVGAGVLMMLGGGLCEFGGQLMSFYLGAVPHLTPDESLVMVHCRMIAHGLAPVLLPVLALLLLAAIASSILQTGFLWVPHRLTPDLNRLNPVAGLGRIFSLQGMMRLGFGLFKVAVVGVVAVTVFSLRWDELFRSSSYEVPVLARYLGDISLQLILWVGIALFLLALADYAFQRWKHEQDLRMTHQEIREELKNMQGDPQILSRRRAVQRQMAMHRIGTAVPKADVVVTNPTELAVAIQYEPLEMAAPVVVAKGAGVIAQRIRRLALEHSIPIIERKPLAQLLYKEVEINRPIPHESYAAVAEVLAYVYQLKGKKPPHGLPGRR